MAIGCGNGNVVELHATVNATKHQAAAAHISAAGKFGGEEQPLSENLKQRLDIFWRSDAAQQDHLAARADRIRERAGVALERNAVAGFGQRDRSGGDFAQFFSRDQSFGGKQAAAGRDHHGAARALCMGRRLRERPRIGQLAAKIKTADEGKTLSEGYAAAAEAKGQREGGILVENQLGADAAYVGRGEKEDAMDGAWRRLGGDAARVGDG